MSYEHWLARIVAAAQNIASDEFQRDAWFPGGHAVSSPDEIYQVLIEDCTFDLFFETYGKSFNEEQQRSWKRLRNALQEYYDKLPASPDPNLVLNDPEWHTVRKIAQEFVRAFSVNS